MGATTDRHGMNISGTLDRELELLMHMNNPPETYISVAHGDMYPFACQCLRAAGLVEEKADFLAQRLIECDLRGVFSHGTRALKSYTYLLKHGKINRDPKPSIVNETPVSMLMDGDGGFGYFAAYEGTNAIIEKAKSQGVGILVTRNHGHIGAAGIYARLPLKHDLLTFVTSGHGLHLTRGKPLFEAAGGSPMAFSAPADTEDPMVLDFGTMHDLYERDPFRDELAANVPGVALRLIGLGVFCQVWGRLLGGYAMDGSSVTPNYTGAHQGSLVITFKISIFAEPGPLKQEIDDYIRKIKLHKPLPGLDKAYQPGGVEAAREREYLQKGIPVGPEHQQILEKVAADLNVTVPWKS